MRNNQLLSGKRKQDEGESLVLFLYFCKDLKVFDGSPLLMSYV